MMIRSQLTKSLSCLTAAGIMGMSMLGPVAAKADQRTDNTVAGIAIGAILGGAIALASSNHGYVAVNSGPVCAPMVVERDRGGRRDWDRDRDNRDYRGDRDHRDDRR